MASINMERLLDGSWLADVGLEQYQDKQVAFVAYVRQNYMNVGLFVLFIFLTVRTLVAKSRDAAKSGANKEYLDAPDFPEIERLENFDWKSEEHMKLRAFKPKYHLTMDFSDETAIQNLDPSELLAMDRTYAERLQYRSKILKKSANIAIGVHDDKRIRPAVLELYTFLLGTYLPKRFPNMFKLHFASFETGDQFMFENLITKQIFPTVPTKVTTTDTLLRTLGVTIDTDFLFLLPEQASESDDPKYVLQAYVCVCPSGWDPREKLGKRLAAIHGPVPGYKDKLEGSMDKYFKNLEVGKYVKRANWGITQNKELFMPDPDSNHGREGAETQAALEIDPDKTFLRVERQTLNRLPKSEAILFAFKTYMDTLRDIKLEGVGDELADAIDGLKSGSVPTMTVYKRSPVWGEAVKEYLRS